MKMGRGCIYEKPKTPDFKIRPIPTCSHPCYKSLMATNPPIRILGLDPGLRFTGWGIIESHGSSLKHIAHGIVKVNPDQSMAERLSTLYNQLATLLTEYKPHEAAVEETFVNKNPASALKLGTARGVILLAPANQGLPVAEYSANKIKKSVVGAGHADKSQVEMMIRTLLPTCGDATKDAADALAVAICHAHHRQCSQFQEVVLRNSVSSDSRA